VTERHMRQLFEEKSPSIKLMQFALYTGGLVSPLLYLLRDGSSTRNIQQSAKRMVDGGYLMAHKVVTGNKQKIRLLIPTEKAESELSSLTADNANLYRPARRVFLSEKCGDRQNEADRQTRLQRQLSFTELAMFTARVCYLFDTFMPGHVSQILPLNKIDITKGEHVEDGLLFLTSKEMKKELDPSRLRSCTGRAHAYLLSDEEINIRLEMMYIRSNCPVIMQKKEDDTRETMNQILELGDNGEINGTVYVSKKLDVIHQLIDDNKNIEKRSKYKLSVRTNTDEAYKVWFVPSTEEGALMLFMLLVPGGEEFLRFAVRRSDDYYPYPPGRFCDFEENDQYHLSFLVPDVYRLKRFLRTVRANPNEKYIIHTCSAFSEIFGQINRSYKNLLVNEYAMQDIAETFWNEMFGDELTMSEVITC